MGRDGRVLGVQRIEGAALRVAVFDGAAKKLPGALANTGAKPDYLTPILLILIGFVLVRKTKKSQIPAYIDVL